MGNRTLSIKGQRKVGEQTQQVNNVKMLYKEAVEAWVSIEKLYVQPKRKYEAIWNAPHICLQTNVK